MFNQITKKLCLSVHMLKAQISLKKVASVWLTL